jgi:hypothetical protein
VSRWCEQLKSWWNVCTHAKEEAGFWEMVPAQQEVGHATVDTVRAVG